MSFVVGVGVLCYIQKGNPGGEPRPCKIGMEKWIRWVRLLLIFDDIIQ